MGRLAVASVVLVAIATSCGSAPVPMTSMPVDDADVTSPATDTTVTPSRFRLDGDVDGCYSVAEVTGSVIAARCVDGIELARSKPMQPVVLDRDLTLVVVGEGFTLVGVEPADAPRIQVGFWLLVETYERPVIRLVDRDSVEVRCEVDVVVTCV